MQRGFKTEAKRFALEVRAELGLDAYDQFDPYALAAEYGIPVYPLSELGDCEVGRAALAHYRERPAAFSAALVPLGNKRLILDNDNHAPVRRRNSVSHEMAHVLLEHPFSQILLTGDGCRVFDKDLEEEAIWLAGELLVPFAAAERAAYLGWSDDQVAAIYDVSRPLARMRMNYSGARRVAARKRGKRSSKV